MIEKPIAELALQGESQLRYVFSSPSPGIKDNI